MFVYLLRVVDWYKERGLELTEAAFGTAKLQKNRETRANVVAFLLKNCLEVLDKRS